MPELPEVETIIRQLRQQIKGQVIKKIDILRPDQWPRNQPEQVQQVLFNKRITEINRRAKFILIDFESGYRLIIHLRMTGKLIWSPGKPDIDKFTRAVLYLADGSSLQFNDTRALGMVALLNSTEKFPALEKLGIEPFGTEWNESDLRAMFKKSRLALKDFLLDQTKVAGIGNIYASEILFRAGLHPGRQANTLSDEEIERLYHIIPRILELAIEQMGTSIGNKISDFRSVYNVPGEFQNVLAVYGREGKPCLKCGSPITRIKQKNRSSFICQNCQK